MEMIQILEAIAEIKIAMKKHRSDWFGMWGTEWEREDWMRKVNRLKELRSMLPKTI